MIQEKPPHYLTILTHYEDPPRKVFSFDKTRHQLVKETTCGTRQKWFSVGCITYGSLDELKKYLADSRDLAAYVQHRNRHCEVDGDDFIDSRRQSDDFAYSCGIVFDIDLPADNDYGVETAADVVAILAKVMPEMSDARYLWNYSSSTNIYAPNGTCVSTKLGFHIRFMTEEPWRHADFDALMKRLVMAGYASIEPATNGALLIRTIFDHLTQQPNRLFYECPPVLKGGLYRPQGSEDFHLCGSGRSRALLPSVSPLTRDEERQYQDCVSTLKLEKRKQLGLCTEVGLDFRCKDRQGHFHDIPRSYVADFFRAEETEYFDLDQEVVTADGQRVRIRDIQEKTEIYSVFRDEDHPSAFVGLNGEGVRYIHDSAINRTFWPKPAILLDEVCMDEAVQINRRFVGDALTFNNGATFLKSGLGTGKTTAIGAYIKGLRDKGDSVLYVCHREWLAKQVAATHGLAFYKDNNALTGRELAICADSVYKLLRGRQFFDHVILDESEQLVRHLTGDTLRASQTQPSQRFNVLTYLEKLLAQSKSVLAIDAHLSQLTKSFIGRALPRVHTREIQNTYQRYAGQRVELFDSGAALLTDFYDHVARGDRVALACDTKELALSVFAKAETDFPDKSGIAITSGGIRACPDSEPVSHHNDLCLDLNRILTDYDYFIYSPTVGSGYSIDEVRFDIVYGHFTYLIPSDNAQQLGRIREASLRKVYCKSAASHCTSGAMPYLVEAEWNRSRELLELLESHDVRFDYDDNLIPHADPRDEGYLKLYTTVKYREYRERAAGVIRLIDLLQGQGFQVEPVTATQDAIEQGRKLLANGKALSEAAYRDGLLQARRITDPEANALRLRTFLPEYQFFELARHALESFYREPVSDELVAFDNKGQMRHALPLFESLFVNDDILVSRDLRRLKQDAHIHEKSHAIRRVLLEELCEKLHNFSTLGRLPEATVCNLLLQVNGFVDVCKDNKELLNYLFRAKIPKDIAQNPTLYLSKILREVGIHSTTKQYRFNQFSDELKSEINDRDIDPLGNGKIRLLRIDSGHFKQLIKYATKRNANLFMNKSRYLKKIA